MEQIKKLLIGGSPCTHWSIAQTKNREKEPSGIGWELFKNFKLALERYRPDYFIYENNKSMAPAIKEQITKELGVGPVWLNSAALSAQSRDRLYWVGRKNADGTYSQVEIEQPEDMGILVRDILEDSTETGEKGYVLMTPAIQSGAMGGKNRSGQTSMFDPEDMSGPVRIGTIESGAKNRDFDSQQYRVYSPDGKSATICGQGGGMGAKTGLYAAPIKLGVMPSKSGTVVNSQNRRVYSIDGKTPTLSARPTGGGVDGPVYAMQIRVGSLPNDAGEVSNCQSRRVYSADGKSVPLCAQGGGVGAKTGLYAIPVTIGQDGDLSITWPDGRTWPVYEVKDGKAKIRGKEYPFKLADGFYIIRKLTVLECKRLQTVPEAYIFPVSDTQAYKMLGNGWTVDIIVHIMAALPGVAGGALKSCPCMTA